MKLSTFVIFLLLFCGGLTACDNNTSSSSGQKNCVVDFGKLMRDSAPGKEGVRLIESMQADMQKDLDAIQDRLEKNPQDSEAMQQLQQSYSLAQQKIQTEGQNIANQIMAMIQDELDKFRAENNYDMIVMTDALASYNPALDKTNKIIERLGKRKLDLKLSQTGNTMQGSPTAKESAEETPAEQPQKKSD